MITMSSDIGCDLVRALASDSAVVTAARVSTLGDQVLELEQSESFGLINYLMKNRHGTPFEHNQFTFFTDAPIFVYRELHRHRIGISINEESGRYKELRPKFYCPPRERDLVQTGKPGHYEYGPGEDTQYKEVVNSFAEVYKKAWMHYEYLLHVGIAKEVARMVLPVSVYSSQYYTCNARSMMAILSLRQKFPEAMFPSKPMYEINQLANKMETIFADLMPLTHRAYVQNGRVAP